MQDNSGLNAGDITNGAHTRSTKKDSSSKKNTTTSNEQSDLEKFIQNYQNASSSLKKEIKSMLESDSVLGNFIKQYRSLDENGQKRVVEKLANPENSAAQKAGATLVSRLKEIQHPNIQSPEIYDPLGMRSKGNSWSSNDKNTQSEEKKKESEKTEKEEKKSSEKKKVEAEQVYEYTYQPGDTFGSVLMKLGISDGRNLWGPNGDVAYYTKQLNDQGIYGNIPIGKTIRLVKKVEK